MKHTGIILSPIFMLIWYFLPIMPPQSYADSSPAAHGSAEPTVLTYRSVQYSTDASTNLMDIVTPAGASCPTPLVVLLFGGGWKWCIRTSFADQQAWLAKLGFASAAVDYRVSGVAPFPAAVEDCKCAIRFLRAHATQYNIDPNRIAVWGDSAGGNLAAMLGTTAGIKGLEGHGGWQNYSSRVQAVVDLFGPSDLKSQVEFPGMGPPTIAVIQ
jgi:acetyl esterase/lipase